MGKRLTDKLLEEGYKDKEVGYMILFTRKDEDVLYSISGNRIVRRYKKS